MARGKTYNGYIERVEINMFSMNPCFSHFQPPIRRPRIYHNIKRLQPGNDINIGTRVRVVVDKYGKLISIKVYDIEHDNK